MKSASRFFLFILLATASCRESGTADHTSSSDQPVVAQDSTNAVFVDSFAARVVLERDITIKKYFPYLDSLVAAWDTLLPYTLTEHLLVRANPWLIDSLVETDYYRLMAKGRFVYDQQKMVILHKGDTLGIPGEALAAELQARIDSTWIDVNIPEFKLRIMERDSELFAFPVRVGRNQKRYLEMAGREVDLRTPIGEGRILRIERNPAWIDPCNCRPYTETHRDDGRVTRCPQIPWLEPEIEGLRPGCLIHPTTNPKTLGKAYSNGCVGMREADSWVAYYHAPVGTRVRFRYELQAIDEKGDSIKLKDIYKLNKK
ncbi:MAG: L,D-transpeptidase [Saprospiraceae bacterium]|nr:L,D-transpeptidase [Saprospiraceae bacterium]